MRSDPLGSSPLSLLGQLHDPFRVAVQYLALPSQRHAAGEAPQERGMKFLLQLLDALGQVGLGVVQPFRGLGDAALGGNGTEVAQRGEIHLDGILHCIYIFYKFIIVHIIICIYNYFF